MITWSIDAGQLVSDLIPAMAIWREASGESSDGMSAVAWVIMNRSRYRKQSISQVCLAKWQFSSMNAPGDAGMIRWPDADDPSFKSAYLIWAGVLNGTIHDPTRGADLYYAVSIPPPSWVSKASFLVQIGKQKFYRERGA